MKLGELGMSLCIEIYKIFSNLNFEFRLRMTVRSLREKGKLNLDEIVLDIFFFTDSGEQRRV